MQHKELAGGKWQRLSLVEQLAHVGSEVSRAIAWKEKSPQDSQLAFERALELLDLTVEDPKNKYRLKEILRVRSALVDYFMGNNEFGSTDEKWNNYFLGFACAARNTHA